MPTLQKLQEAEAKAKAKKLKAVPLERAVEKPVKDYARSRGFYVRKFKSANNRSVPDGIFATPFGVVFFIEFKRPGKRATPAQADEHAFMRQRKLTVYVVDNVTDGKKIIDTYASQE
ncbi:MAG: hypothetical protein DDT26_00280 [Dehalococcoidia bacterium]|nr:hypothetical protein [Chloroflexota bacterium]